MLIDSDIKPDRQLYALGATLLGILKHEIGHSVNIYDLHEAFRERTSMGAESFFLALDWLFLLGVVEMDEGGLRKCF